MLLLDREVFFSVRLPHLPPVTNLIFALVPKQKNQTLLELHVNETIGAIGAAALGEGIAVNCVARAVDFFCWWLPPSR